MKNYVTLKDGTKLNKLGIGTWYMGDNPEKEKEEIEAIRYAIDNGINLIDTAEMYGDGRSEILVGKAISIYEREKLFLVSKVLPINANKKRIFESVENTLKRLKTDYLDLYLLHWREDYTSLHDVFDCMEELKKMGKIKRWGVSNFDIDDMIDISKIDYLDSCFVNQVLYHLGSRGIEYSLKPYTDNVGIVTMAYSPLARAGELKDKILESDAVMKISKKYNITPIQVLLTFVLTNDNMIAIPKASKQEHVKQNIECLNISFDKEDMKLLDDSFPAPDYKVELDEQ